VRLQLRIGNVAAVDARAPRKEGGCKGLAVGVVASDACCWGGGGMGTSASDVGTWAASCMGVPQLGQKRLSSVNP
jgi:hypothetical protein